MKKIFYTSNRMFLLVFILFIHLNSTFAQNNKNELNNDQCLKCHMELDILPDGFSIDDIHMQKGLSCAGCHGGDPTSDDEDIAMSDMNNFIGAPEKTDIPEFCGKCHSDIKFMRRYQPGIQTDQVNQYYTSIHGQKLKKGDLNVADCSDCHSSHNILKIKDPLSTVYSLNVPATCNKCHGDSLLMSKYNLEADQFKKYSKSVHGVALLRKHDTGAPACNDCHGNHGAIPPNVRSISHVCGTCHQNNMNYLEGSAMAESLSDLEHGACEPCHGYHEILKPNDNMLGNGKKSVCEQCHDEDDDGFKTGLTIKNYLSQLQTAYNKVDSSKIDITIKGMNDIEIGFTQKEIRQQLIQARTAVHSFDSSKVKEFTQKGIELTSKAMQLVDQENDEYYRRRYGFIYTSIFFFALGLGLYFKIKGN